MPKLIYLSHDVYKIKANKAKNYFIGIANQRNLKHNTVETVGQDKEEYAIYFSTEDEAKTFLKKYFVSRRNWIKPENKDFYEITQVHSVYGALDKSTTIYGVKCLYSSEAYNEWVKSVL